MDIKEVIKIFRKKNPKLVPNSIVEIDKGYIIGSRGKELPLETYYTGTMRDFLWKDSKKIERLDIEELEELMDSSSYVVKHKHEEFEKYNKLKLSQF